ncbi:MAG: trypsin-like serine protease [Verrucomicrobiales bacterium]|nr:trypsin-like serine protease [Verrucomicrobiales bacterium]
MAKNKSISILALALGWVAGSAWLFGQDEKGPKTNLPPDPFKDAESGEVEGARFIPPGKIAELTKKLKPSLVSIVQIGRDGDDRGTGSGFVISKDGLIATNLHVIGEGRSVRVEFSDGESREVKAVHAWDRHYDLAVVKVDPKGLDLKPMKIGDSETVTQGQLILGFGSPRGLKFSVVSGVVSAIRELDEDFLGDAEDTPDYPMIQIAMPIEQGNSGGPIVNLEGEAIGIVTLKHMRTRNLGFAVRSSDLEPLLKKPNSTPMNRWKTIGSLDPRDWTPKMGATWTQNGGTIQVNGFGSGFGGRSICVSEIDVPKDKFDLAVRVKLDNEAGAAGLMFSSDGGDVHYGFYPTNGQIRLTRFEGPDVNSWTILETLDSEAYKIGTWNRLRVRVDGDEITGFVNGKKVLKVKDDGGLGAGGKVGLCKFRQTEAGFRGFKIGKDLTVATIDEELMTKLGDAIDALAAAEKQDQKLVDQLGAETDTSRALLEKKAKQLEAQAAELRKLGVDLHTGRVAKNLSKLLEKEEIDLFEAGLQIAWIDNPELDLPHYRNRFDRLENDAREFMGEKKTDTERLESLRYFLFEENGFHGSRSEYYHHANSYVNSVLDDREGLPITLSVVFMELARRLEIKGVKGVPLPGHFLVGRFAGEKQDELKELVDVFESGKIIDREEAEKIAWSTSGVYATDDHFEPAGEVEIVIRMLRNLIGLEIDNGRNPEGATQYLDLVLAIAPDSAQERFQRSLIRIQMKNRTGAEEDLDWLLENRPAGIDYNRLQMFRDRLDEIIGENE